MKVNQNIELHVDGRKLAETVTKHQRRATPVCPSCGAKFSRDVAQSACKECGLPDEIADLGPTVIARWKRKKFGKIRPKGRHPNRKRRGHGRQ